MHNCSFVVDTEDDTSAPEGLICVGVGRVVVVGLIPQALAGDAHSLLHHLANNALHNNFVTGDAQLLRLVFDLDDDGLGLLLVLLLVELLSFKFVPDAALNDRLHLCRVEALVLTRLHPVSGEVRHTLVSEVHDFVVGSISILNY